MNKCIKSYLVVGVSILFTGVVQALEVRQTYYVPFPENDAKASFDAIMDYNTQVGPDLRTVISIVVASEGTVIYYDQWEDGFEKNIGSPTQATTAIWGDDDDSNGKPPGYLVDNLDAGDIINLEETIDVTRNQVQVEYDGGDKFAVTKPVAMSRALYGIPPGEVLAGSVQAYDASLFGLTYRAPVGSGTGTGAETNTQFEYSSMYIMAAYDFTRVDIDVDNDGTVDQTVRLDEGEGHYVNGGIVAGATVNATKPVQCHMITGDIGSVYEMRFFTLWPESQWDSEYITPVSSRLDDGGTVGSLVYFFNPNDEQIEVFYQTVSSSGSVIVASNSVSEAYEMPVDSGGYFYTTNDAVFIAAQSVDSLYGHQNHDWGLGLPPLKTLTTVSIAGWAPGYGVQVTGADTNANPLWVTALQDTTVFVDLDGDPETGPLLDSNGERYDYSTNVTALRTAFVTDPNDADQTGIRLYTLDGVLFVTGWGQDTVPAGISNPYLDMGNIILPFPTIIAQKLSSLLVDVNTNGIADPGDVLEFSVDVINVGFATANNVMMYDDGGNTNILLYVTNSSAINGVYVPDNLPPKITPYPFDENGYNIGTVPVDQTSTVTYALQIRSPYPTNEGAYLYNSVLVGNSNGNWNTLEWEAVNVPGLYIQKTSSATNLLDPGDTFTYTITVGNTGSVTYTGLELRDSVPVGLAFVPGSLVIDYPIGWTNTWRDRFDGYLFSNQDGDSDWLTDWQEINETDGVAGGYARVMNDAGVTPVETHALRITDPDGNGTGYGVYRLADLSQFSAAELSFEYRRENVNFVNDQVSVYVSDNGGASWTLLDTFQGPTTVNPETDPDYIYTNYTIDAFIATNTAIRFLSNGQVENGEYFFFDNITISATESNGMIAGGTPPTLFEELLLPPGTSIVASMQVTVYDPPQATQALNTACVRAEQHEEWLCNETPVTNLINAVADLMIEKTTSTTNILNGGEQLTYTITVSSSGNVYQTNIDLNDTLPAGVSYLPGSARLWRPYLHTNRYRDQFDLAVYTNDDGNLPWETAWQEQHESDGPIAGNVLIDNDYGVIPGRNYALLLGETGRVVRLADLSACSNNILSFEYRRDSQDAGDDSFVDISADGGATWTQLDTFPGAATDDHYIYTNYNIDAYAASNTAVRFRAEFSFHTGGDRVWFDNVELTGESASSTNSVFSPPHFVQGISLPPGTSIVVTLDVLVDDPPTATQLVNTASVRSDQITDPRYSSVTNLTAGTAEFSFQKSASLPGLWEMGETNTYTLSMINTGLLQLTGIIITDALPDEVSIVPSSVVVVADCSQTNTYIDTFNTAAYTNNYGNVDWLAGWQEVNDTGDPTHNGGAISILANRLRLSGIDTEYIERSADLSRSTEAVFSYNWEVSSIDPPESISVLIATNASGPFVELAGYQGTAGSGSEQFDISAYTSSNTTIRLANIGTAFNSQNDQAFFDNIQIISSYPQVTTNAGSLPPVMVQGMHLPTGGTLTVTMDAVLDVPLTQTQFINTATAVSDHAYPRTSSVTNHAELVSIGDRIFFDANTNSVQDGGDTGIPNITVSLYDGNSNLVAVTVTDTNGLYLFSGYPSGNYQLIVDVPSNYIPVTADVGGDLADSDIDSLGRMVMFTLSGTTNDLSRDGGLYQPVSSIGNLVWYDSNTNGIQDGGETGLTNVLVRLYDSSSNLIQSTATDSSGSYQFSNVTPGSYFVEITPPAGFAYTITDAGGDDSLDSDAAALTDATGIFFLPPGVSDQSRDIGLVPEQPALQVSVTSDAGDCLLPGESLTYTVTVENTGTVSVSDVEMADVLPVGVTYAPGSAIVAAPEPVGTDFWNTAWSYRMPLTFDNSAQSASLTGFPVLVSLDTNNYDFSTADAAGADIRFIDADNSTALDYEIEQWSATQAYIWVEVPVIDGGSDSDYIYLYWGNTNAVDAQDATNVWEHDYVMVWHMDETAGNHLDVTGNGNDGTPAVTVQGSAAGRVGGASQFDGVDDDVDFGSSASLDALDVMTAEAWISTADNSQDNQTVHSFYFSNNERAYSMYDIAGGLEEFWIWNDIDNQGAVEAQTGQYLPANNEWLHLVWRIDGSTWKLYINGVEQGSTAQTLTMDDLDDGFTGSIGRRDVQDSRPFNGVIDEVRISRIARSADWIRAAYLSESITNGFVTTGLTEPQNGRVTVTNSSSGPAILGSGYTLEPGEQIVATFSAMVDGAGMVTQLINQAYTYGAAQPAVGATVSNCIEYTDLGVVKDVTDRFPGIAEIIEYTLTVSNTGPQLATGVEVLDVFPGPVDVQYNSYSNGVFNSTNGIWYLGTLPVGSATTLYVNVTVQTGTEGTTITNYAYVTALDQIDIVSTNNESEAPISPTAVILDHFTAGLNADGAYVEWETVSEVGTVGFYVRRLNPEAGVFEPVNRDLLPGLLTSPQGGTYRVLDPAAEPGGRYTYELVEIDLAGGEMSYGPFTVDVPVQAARAASDRSKSKEKQDRKAAFSREKRPPERASMARRKGMNERHNKTHGDGSRLKIAVSEEGMYHVDIDEAATLLNVPKGLLQRLLVKDQLELRTDRQPVPYMRSPGGLYFYGVPRKGIFGQEQIYWLGWGPAAQMSHAEKDNGAYRSVDRQDYNSHLTFESNLWAATALFDDPRNDFWLWEYLVAGNASFSNRTFEVDVPGAQTTAPAELKLTLQGSSSTGVTNEHAARIRLNGSFLADYSFTGSGQAVARIPLPAGRLADGVNTLEIQAVRSQGVAYSIWAVNRIEISYRRRYEAQQDVLSIQVDQPGVLIEADGFSQQNIVVLDVTDPYNAMWISDVRRVKSGDGYSAAFLAGDLSQELYLFAEENLHKAELTRAAAVMELTDSRNAADAVVIVPRELTSGLKSWIRYREAEGWNVMVVPLDAVYDVFNDGMPDPQAINSFLRHAYLNWEQPPLYAVLAGTGTYDYKNTLQKHDNLIPVQLVDTPHGLFASDSSLGDVVGGDGVPEVIVSRIPVLNASELHAYLQKVMDAEAVQSQPPLDVVFAADNPDQAGDFHADSDRVRALVPSATAGSIYLEQDVTAARAQLLQTLQQGVRVLNYLGHGGLDRLAQEGLLRNSDVAQLTNTQHVPVVVGLTCIMGRFELPGHDCLAERLLTQPQGGAAAVWTASGMSINRDAVLLDEGFLDAYFNRQVETVGEAVRSAYEYYADRSSTAFMMNVYNLFGDPLQRLP